MTKTELSTAALLLSLLDLTRLQEPDAPENIDILCSKAISPYGNVAAACVYPQFVSQAVHNLSTSHVRVASVANFPDGNTPIEKTLNTIEQILQDGGQELDVVIPYQALMAGEDSLVFDYLSACREASQNHCLKIILETGMLMEDEHISHACEISIATGADMLKTSTGKVPINATLDAAQIMLAEIAKAHAYMPNRCIGLKLAGGIRSIEQATPYLTLAERIMGTNYLSPRTLRFGASALIDELHQRLSNQ